LQFTQHECLIPDLARSLDLVHLSDFHASSDVSQSLIERAIESAIGARADFICVTGDFVTTANKITQKEVTVQVVGLDDLLARQFDARAAFDRADSQCLTCFHITPTARFS